MFLFFISDTFCPHLPKGAMRGAGISYGKFFWHAYCKGDLFQVMVNFFGTILAKGKKTYSKVGKVLTDSDWALEVPLTQWGWKAGFVLVEVLTDIIKNPRSHMSAWKGVGSSELIGKVGQALGAMLKESLWKVVYVASAHVASFNGYHTIKKKIRGHGRFPFGEPIYYR